ncbi:MAG: aromatic ring-hydroxylating dioxygenase subunit alpha [Planctomycetaceae bacterium]|nr:aromatic ring-hydroxylating dioxygenase subunit alpha [Planctomycetaceae bacterium]
MFSHKNSLRHLLLPAHYCDEAHFHREIEQLFLPGWHFAAAVSELPRDGDFLTLELFGQPLLIRNSGGRLLAFENICCHRHCLLTDAAFGNQPKLKCRYHGWEYDDDGATARIPEARCFRPWDRENSRLNRFRLETCGDLIFVSFSADAVPLREWLSPFYEETERAFRRPAWLMRRVWEYDCPCNWKVPAENTLESYHVTALHPSFFGPNLPPEQNAEHLLDHRYTALTFTANSRMEQWQAQLSRWLGTEPTLEYRHRHIHPNTILVSTDTINYALMYQPLTATTVRVRVRLFALRGTRRGLGARLASECAWRIGWKNTRQVHNEDISIYPAQQRGLERSRHPGVLGTREERIFAFQQYILSSLGIPMPPSVEPVLCTPDESTDSS